MSIPQPGNVEGTAVSQGDLPLSDERMQFVNRIAGSQTFAKARQLRDILCYIGMRTFQEGAVSIPEHEIACGVLGRRDSFDPSEDNIVRVQFGHLRKKLEQYFATEGCNEPLLLSIPRGSYVPRLEPYTAIKPIPIPDGVAVLAGNGHEKWLGWLMRRWVWVVAIIAIQAVTGAVFYRLGGAVQRTSPPPDPIEASEINGAQNLSQKNLIAQRIFRTNLPVSVVITDANLVLLQNVLYKDIPISDYINYPDSILSDKESGSLGHALAMAASYRYTTIGDLNIALKCDEIAQMFGTKIVVRFARYTNVRDFEHGNFVLIGSRRGNPWVSLFEPKLNFFFKEQPGTHAFYFENRHPARGEQAAYYSVYDKHGGDVSYVDVALLQNLAKNGYVLLLDGAVMEANEAAAQLIFGNNLPQTLSRLIDGKHPAGDHGPIEIFLRVHAIEGTASSIDLVAVRPLQEPD